MRWLASFLIVISIGGCFCDDDDDEPCFLREMMKCEAIEPPSEFPQTAEELLAACQIVISMGNCMLDVEERCIEEPNLRFTHRAQNAIEYLKSTCQEDNPTFKVITSNLPCIARAAKSRGKYCGSTFSQKTGEAIDTHIELLIGGDYDTALADCLFDVMDIACEGAIFGYHCGEEVKDAVEEIEAHVNSQGSYECSPEHLEELSPFMGVFEGLVLEEVALQNALERKRR